MNSKTVHENNEPPSVNPSFEEEKTSFVKVYTEGNGLSEQFSPIVANRTSMKKNTTYPNIDGKARQKRNPWTKEEDTRLTELIQREMDDATSQGINYLSIANELNSGRTSKQCRDRWTNFLRDGIKKGDWTIEEEELIKDLFVTFGPKWSVMAKLFKDRTDNDIKNKWYSMKRKDERNGTNQCDNPFMNLKSAATVLPTADYSTQNHINLHYAVASEIDEITKKASV